MPNLLELMSPDEKKKAIERGEKRLARKKGASISPEIYVVAEFGSYFGWEGVLAIKRGYIEKINGKGVIEKEPFTLEEALALLEGARKVRYSQLIENAQGSLVATHSSRAKSPGDAFKSGMRNFEDRASL